MMFKPLAVALCLSGAAFADQRATHPDIDWCSALTNTPGVTHAACNARHRQFAISGQAEDGELFRIDMVGDNVSINGGPWVSLTVDPRNPQAGLELATKLQVIRDKSGMRGPSSQLVLCSTGEVRVRYMQSLTPEALCADSTR